MTPAATWNDARQQLPLLPQLPHSLIPPAWSAAALLLAQEAKQVQEEVNCRQASMQRNETCNVHQAARLATQQHWCTQPGWNQKLQQAATH